MQVVSCIQLVATSGVVRLNSCLMLNLCFPRFDLIVKIPGYHSNLRSHDVAFLLLVTCSNDRKPLPNHEAQASGFTRTANALREMDRQESHELNTIAPDGTEEHGRREDEACRIPPSVTRRLYISHFLSTWNARSFEFGAVLFLAAIFPGTLLQLSIYAIIRSASAIVLAPLVGHIIDTCDRLQTVRMSIGTCIGSMTLETCVDNDHLQSCRDWRSCSRAPGATSSFLTRCSRTR